MIAHHLTLEQVPLPVVDSHKGQLGEYELGFDDDGFAVVGSCDWAEPVEDLLKIQVFEDDTGHLYFMQKDKNGFEIVESKCELELRFEYCHLEVQFGSADTNLIFDVAKYERSRPDGSRILWSMLSA